MEHLWFKILLSFKFILLIQLLNVFAYLRGKTDALVGFAHYFFISLCVIIRTILCLEVLLVLPFTAVYFILKLILFKEFRLGFSDKYIDTSKLSLLFYVIFWKIPFGASMFIVYVVLRKFLNKNERVRLDLKSIFINIVFVNVFGSPQWLFEKSFKLSNGFEYLFRLDLSKKKEPWKVRLTLCTVYLNEFLYVECSYYIDKCNASRVYYDAHGLRFNMLNKVFQKHVTKGEHYSKTALTLRNGEFIRHPIIPNDGVGKSYTTGYLITHNPLRGQKSLKYTFNPREKESHLVFNGYQEKSCIVDQGFAMVDKNKEGIETVKAAAEASRYLYDDPIFMQFSKNKGFLKDKNIGCAHASYSNLTLNDAVSIGMTREDFIEIDRRKKDWCFDSDSENDLILNALHGITRDVINEKGGIGINLENRRGIGVLKNLSAKDRLVEENKKRLLWNEYCLSDDEILNRSILQDREDDGD